MRSVSIKKFVFVLTPDFNILAMPVSLVATRFRLRRIGALEEDNVPTRAQEQGLLHKASKKQRPITIKAFLGDNECILIRLLKVFGTEDCKNLQTSAKL